MAAGEVDSLYSAFMEDVGSKGEDGRRDWRPKLGVVSLEDARKSVRDSGAGGGVGISDGIDDGVSGMVSTLKPQFWKSVAMCSEVV